jgi:hypothetical protein
MTALAAPHPSAGRPYGGHSDTKTRAAIRTAENHEGLYLPL